MIKRSVITLASYDAHLLPNSISSYYEYVDEIIIGLDKDRISWSNNNFFFDEEALWKSLSVIDGDNKIEIVEENFHQSEIPIENDNYERNFLKQQCTNDWIFSFDADEDLVNGKDFFLNFIPIVEPYYNKVDLRFTWFLPFKDLGEDILMIANHDGTFSRGDNQGFATSKDKNYVYCRWTDNKKTIATPLAIMHWSFCRNKKELEMKLNNFGHSDKSKEDPFFHNWNMVDENNYTQLVNFKTSGMGANQWERLIKIPKKHLNEVAQQQAGLVY